MLYYLKWQQETTSWISYHWYDTSNSSPYSSFYHSIRLHAIKILWIKIIKTSKNIYNVNFKCKWCFTTFCNGGFFLIYFFFCISAYKKNVKQIDQWKIQNCNMHSEEAWHQYRMFVIYAEFGFNGITVQLWGRILMKNFLGEKQTPCQNQSATCHQVVFASKPWITPALPTDSSKF